jgi:hypothetical protein
VIVENGQAFSGDKGKEVYCTHINEPAETNYYNGKDFCQFCGSTDHQEMTPLPDGYGNMVELIREAISAIPDGHLNSHPVRVIEGSMGLLAGIRGTDGNREHMKILITRIAEFSTSVLKHRGRWDIDIQNWTLLTQRLLDFRDAWK